MEGVSMWVSVQVVGLLTWPRFPLVRGSSARCCISLGWVVSPFASWRGAGTYCGALPPFCGWSFAFLSVQRKGEVARWWWKWFNTNVERLFVFTRPRHMTLARLLKMRRYFELSLHVISPTALIFVSQLEFCIFFYRKIQAFLKHTYIQACVFFLTKIEPSTPEIVHFRNLMLSQF
jgi:hypothetical protein